MDCPPAGLEFLSGLISVQSADDSTLRAEQELSRYLNDTNGRMRAKEVVTFWKNR